MALPRIEITIPVLNEEETLEANIRAVLDFAKRSFSEPSRIGLVIADNGSTDATRAIASRLAREHGCVRVLRLPRPGVGAALKQSWLSSDADIVGYMDLDLATDLKHLPEAIAALTDGGFDLCYGSRLAKGADVTGRKFNRTLVSHAFNLMLRHYARTGISDGMCGFKFLRRPVLEALIARGAVSNGWFFSTELLLAGERLGLGIKELPVKWTDDPDSRVRVVKLTLEYLRAMRVFRARDLVSRYEAEQRQGPGDARSKETVATHSRGG